MTDDEMKLDMLVAELDYENRLLRARNERLEKELEQKSDLWKDAVIDQLVCCHIYQKNHDNDPRKALNDLISWNVQVALDPLVSSDAQALINKGAAEEREACARLCDAEWSTMEEKRHSNELADSIRARGKA